MIYSQWPRPYSQRQSPTFDEQWKCTQAETRATPYCCWPDPWWRHQMEAFSALLALCEGNPPVTAGFPLQRPVTRSFVVFFDLHLNKQLSKQSRPWWFETTSRHYNVTVMNRQLLTNNEIYTHMQMRTGGDSSNPMMTMLLLTRSIPLIKELLTKSC